jgi:hypothetical protein
MTVISRQRGITFADTINVANELTLKWAQCNYKYPLKWKKEAEELVRVMCCEKQSTSLFLAGGERINEVRSTGACRTWKRKETILHRNAALRHLGFSPVIHFNSDLVFTHVGYTDNKSVILYTIVIVAYCSTK